jgi:large repetitive protein
MKRRSRMKKHAIAMAVAISLFLIATRGSAGASLIGDSVQGNIAAVGVGSLMGNPTHYVATQFTSPKTVVHPGIEFTGKIATNNQNVNPGPLTYSFANVTVDVKSNQFTVTMTPDSSSTASSWYDWCITLSDLDWSIPNEQITGVNLVSTSIQMDDWEGIIADSGRTACVCLYDVGLVSGGTATFEFLTQQASGQALTNDVPVTNISQSKGNWKSYYIDVPAGMQTLTIQTSGGTGDADLYVRRGSLPTLSTWDYRSWNYGNTETITVYNPVAARYYIGLYAYTAFSGVSLRATYVSGTMALTNGVAVTSLSGATGSMKGFYIDVPAGQATLTVQIWGGTGDCDLYVKYGSAPTTSSYDYRPWLAGNNETVTINSPTAGRWYIGLHAYSAYSNVSLRATYTTAITALTNDVPVTSLSGAAGSMRYFYIDVPVGQTTLAVQTWGGTGDCDLYVSYGSTPTISSYGYRSWNYGNTETITVNNPTAGRWYVGLHAWSAYSGLTLNARYSAPSLVTDLTSGVPISNISGPQGSMYYYRILVSSGQGSLTIQTYGGTGDCDLYVKLGSMPTTTSYDYRPYLSGNNETVTINNPAPGYWYIGLRGYFAYSGLTLRATISAYNALVNNVAVTSLSGGAGTWKNFIMVLPPGQSKMTIQTSGGTGDCDLYVKYGTLPTLASYDYRPWLAGNNETVTINNPASGFWYVSLYGYFAYSGLTLKATYY